MGIAVSAGGAEPTGATTKPDSSSQLEQLNDRLNEADKQIDALRQEIQRLQAQQTQNESVHAATRPAAPATAPLARTSTIPAEGTNETDHKNMTAGYDGHHFFIGSADGRYKLSLEGQIDVRYMYNSLGNSDDGDNDVQGFQLRYAKLGVFGYIGDPKLSYKIKGEFDRDGGTMSLEDAWIAYQFDKQWRIKAGQFDSIFLREYNISSKAQQAVERSTVTRYFDDHATQGLMVNCNTGRWHHTAELTAGPDQAGTDFTAGSRVYEWALTGRSEFLIAGNWKQFEDFAAWSDEPLGLMAGAAVSWDKGANYPGATNPDLIKYTADISAKLDNGINLFGAFVGQHVNADSGAVSPDGDQYGLIAQAGAFVVPNKMDLFIRYAYADLKGAYVDNENDAVTAISDDMINTLTVGTNYYFQKQRVKLTFDIVYALDPIDSHVASTATGLLPDSSGGQLVFRTQLQLLF
jgi:phosphate-selective porin